MTITLITRNLVIGSLRTITSAIRPVYPRKGGADGHYHQFLSDVPALAPLGCRGAHLICGSLAGASDIRLYRTRHGTDGDRGHGDEVHLQYGLRCYTRLRHLNSSGAGGGANHLIVGRDRGRRFSD